MQMYPATDAAAYSKAAVILHMRQLHADLSIIVCLSCAVIAFADRFSDHHVFSLITEGGAQQHPAQDQQDVGGGGRGAGGGGAAGRSQLD